ncbi:hypothetical protein N7470_003218 [Penicillium chermesinum]|nr:hypothetical protein N7470_003218 [Penicillium chermesinum]
MKLNPAPHGSQLCFEVERLEKKLVMWPKHAGKVDLGRLWQDSENLSEATGTLEYLKYEA